jgi:hypothetical protein
MPPFAYFGVESSGLSLGIDLLIVFVVVLYLSLIYWTYTDARRRILDAMLVGCSTAASLFPFVGTIIYMILRPPEYLDDVRERELEMQAAEARVFELERGLCPHCDYSVEPDFVRCPSCLRKLKERCVSCSRPLDRTWTICPYCETEVAGGSATRRTRRRRPPPPEGERAETDQLVVEKERGERARPEKDGAPAEPVAASEPLARPHSSAARASSRRRTP